MKKDLLILGFIALFIVIIIQGTEIQSVEEYCLTHIDDIREDSEIVTVGINCDTILENWNELAPELKDEKYVPKDGVILEPTEYVIRPKDTAFDILSRVTRHNKIQMEYQGADKNSFGSTYIQGINYLYEFSCGPLSGWMFMVNGEFPDYGSSKYIPKDGDVIEWVYSCDLGRDVGADFINEKKTDEQ